MAAPPPLPPAPPLPTPTTTTLPTPTTFAFPFTPYAIQIAFMRHVYTAIERGQVAVMESPTGTVRRRAGAGRVRRVGRVGPTGGRRGAT